MAEISVHLGWFLYENALMTVVYQLFVALGKSLDMRVVGGTKASGSASRNIVFFHTF